MSSFNEATLLGVLGRDPEIRNLSNGNKIASFSIATSDVWKDRNSGERKESTEWHNVVIFNERLVDIASQYLKKGSKVFVKGKIKTRKWQDNNGNDKYTTEIVLEQFRGEIVMLGEPKNNSTQTARVQEAYAPSGSSPRRGNLPVNEDLDDSIPF